MDCIFAFINGKSGLIRMNDPILEQLETGLSQALAQLRENERWSATIALEALLTFIDAVPGWERRKLGLPVWTLLAALKDLDNGRVVPMLLANPDVHNRKPETVTRKVVKAWVVFLVDVLRRSGLSVMEACRIVAHELERNSIPVGGKLGTPPWKTVSGWRGRMTKLPQDDQSREVYENLRPAIDRMSFRSPEDAKQFVAGQLQELIAPLGKTAVE
jgi:hypothetical protein